MSRNIPSPSLHKSLGLQTSAQRQSQMFRIILEAQKVLRR